MVLAKMAIFTGYFCGTGCTPLAVTNQSVLSEVAKVRPISLPDGAKITH